MHPANPINGGKWGLMGGVFDPVHYGHLLLAESARQSSKLDGVLFLPNLNPPHRECKPTASFEDRLMMTRLAVEGNNFFVVSDLEKELASPGYTIAVVELLEQRYPRADWHLVLGADNISIFDSWYKPEELVGKVKIIVGNRPGYDKAFETSPWFEKVKRFDMPLIELAATDIRKAVKEGRSIRYMIPEEVRKFIGSRGLYR